MSKYELHKNAGTVNYQDWHDLGVRIPIFDVDGTLTSHRSTELDKTVMDCLKSQNMPDIFPDIAIATNNPNLAHVEIVANKMHVRLGVNTYIASVAMGMAKKPNPAQGLNIAQHFEVTPNQLGVVGDRRISDVRFAYNLGAGAMALCIKIGQEERPVCTFCSAYRRFNSP